MPIWCFDLERCQDTLQAMFLRNTKPVGKGWGNLAKTLGIKPGSREFHALKRGHDLYDENPTCEDKAKAKTKGNGKGKK